MKHLDVDHLIHQAVLSATPRTELKRLRSVKTVKPEPKRSALLNALGEAASAVMLTAVASISLIGFASGG